MNEKRRSVRCFLVFSIPKHLTIWRNMCTIRVPLAGRGAGGCAAGGRRQLSAPGEKTQGGEMKAWEAGVVHLESWLAAYAEAVEKVFADRIKFIGIQGSYARGEASASSDIDVVMILDELNMEDLARYRGAIAAMPEREKICGFVSGLGELKGWPPQELFQFYHDTRAIRGSLDFLLPLIGDNDVEQAALMGASNIYHMCVHNYVHERSGEMLRALLKAAVFVLQAKHFLKTRRYISKRAELMSELEGMDLRVLQAAAEVKAQPAGAENGFDSLSGLLLAWSGGLICKKASQPADLRNAPPIFQI